MKILVTGGAGFIGSHYIKYNLSKNQDDKVVCVDKLTYAGNMNNLKEVTSLSAFRFYRTDICDKKEITEIFKTEKPDVVINFAAESHVDRSITGPDEFVRTNVLGTACLLDCCIECKIHRFHQISTDEVYGDIPVSDTKTKFKEDDVLRPSSPYSSSKASADLIALSYHRTYGLHVTITRSCNNYGPNQYPEKLIPLMVKKYISGEDMPVYGDGQNVREWIHVLDNVRMIDRVVEKGKPGEIYNVGSGKELSNIEIVNRITDILGGDKSRIKFIEDRLGHDRKYAVNSDKVHSELQLKAELNFDSEFIKTVWWYKNFCK